MQGHQKFGNDLWKNKWCKFEMDAVEYYEGSQMKTKVTVKGKFSKERVSQLFGLLSNRIYFKSMI